MKNISPGELKTVLAIVLLSFAISTQAAVTTTGDINPADPTTWTTSTNGSVGYSADGTMVINSGSSVSSSAGYLGYNSSVTGAATVTGAGSTWTSVNNFIIGRYGAGILTLVDGGTISNNYGTIGWLEGSVGTVTVDNGVWNNVNELRVGDYGTGTLTIANGGTIGNSAGYLGANTGASGTVVVTGTDSSWINTGDLRIGGYGDGTLNILDGGSVSSLGGIIGRDANATKTLFGTGTVTVNNGSWTISNGLLVGYSGDATLHIENGGIVNNASWAHIADGATSVGAATVTGADSTWNSGGSVWIGSRGDGTLDIEDGGLLSSAGGSIGYYLDSSGSVTVNNGTWTNSGELIVGREGTGTLIIENGGTVNNTFAAISQFGRLAGSSGSATVTGAGSTWTSSGNLVVGGTNDGSYSATNGLGDGTLSINNGGAVSNVNGYIGSDADAIGTVSVSGSGSTWTNSGTLTIGRNGDGTLNISNGGAVNNANGFIGDSPTSTGAVTVNGATSTWTNSGTLFVGYNSTGTLEILNGGRIDSSYGFIGDYSTGSGTVTVDGTGSTWSSTSGFTIGNYGSGDLTIRNSGTVTNNGNAYVGFTDPEAIGTVNINGSSSSWSNSGDLTIGYNGSGTLNITSGGTVSNADGYVGMMTNSLGNVTVTGAGSTWSNSGDLSIGTAGNGELNISSGGEVLALSATIGTTGLLSGDGLMTLSSGSGTLTNFGTIAPGNSIGTLTVDGDVIFENGSTFEVEIDNSGNSDKLDVTGDVTINSGSTIAINSNGETITDGKEYTLIEAGGSITGEFTILDTALVTWDAAVENYEMSYDTTTATLVIGTPSVNPFDTPTLLITENQLACGGAVEQIANDGGTLGGITAALQGIVGDDEFRYAYDQLSGQTRPSIAPIADAGVSSFTNTILTNIHSSQAVEIATNDHEYYFWVKGFGDFGKRDSKDGVNGSDYKTGGIATGLDYLITKDFRAGVGLGLSTTDVDYDDTRDSSNLDSFYSALYGNYHGFGGYIDAVLSYAYLDSETDRYVDFVNENNKGDFNGYEIMATVEAAKNYSFKSILIQPLLGFELGYQYQESYTEIGGSSALHFEEQTYKTYRGSLGVKTSKYFYKNDNNSLWGQLQAKWVHEFGDTAADIDVSFASTPGYRFTVKDAEMNRNSAILSAGLRYEPRINILLFVDYDAHVNNDTFNHILSGGLRLAF